MPSTADIYRNPMRDLLEDPVMPVHFASVESGHGIHPLLKALRREVSGDEVTAARRGMATDRGVTAEVFRTLFAGQTGELLLARVWAGEVGNGFMLGQDRIGRVSILFGRKTTPR